MTVSSHNVIQWNSVNIKSFSLKGSCLICRKFTEYKQHKFETYIIPF